MELSRELAKLRQEIAQLERLFNRYFTGVDKRPPVRVLEALQKKVNILTVNTHLAKTAAEKFQLQTVVQQFTAYRTKWERGVRDIEEGRTKPGQHYFGGIGLTPSDEAELSGGADDEMDEIQHLAKEVDSAVDRYVHLAEERLGKHYSTDSVRVALESKLDSIRQKYGNNVSLDVVFEDGRIKIKPKRRS